MKTTIIGTLSFLAFPFIRVQAQNGLRGLAPLNPSCGVTGFQLYEFDDEGIAQRAPSAFGFDTTLDLTDHHLGKINIEAQVTDGCRPRCVKLSYEGREKKERKSPYMLYGDNNRKILQGRPRRSGDQELKACLYTDKSCTQGEYGCQTLSLHVIPANEPLKAQYELKTLTVVFEGTEGSATAAQTTNAAAAVCETLGEYLRSGAFYKSDVGVDEFVCSGTAAAAEQSSLTIAFETTASVYKSPGWNPYGNLNLPDADLVYERMTDFLINNYSVSPGAPAALDYIVEKINDSTSPYSSGTSFTVV
jgi:hypothetical protein